MSKNKQPFFKHIVGMRNDPAIVILQEIGFPRAYEQWCIILELAIEYNAIENNGTFKINYLKLAKELKVKTKMLDKIIETFPKHLKVVLETSQEHSKNISKKFSEHSGNITSISVHNLLQYIGNPKQNRIDKNRIEEKRVEPHF